MIFHLFTAFILLLAPLGASERVVPVVDRGSLPDHWFARDASEFAKLGMTAQTLVYQPHAGQRPLATVELESRVLAHELPEDPRAWTKILIPTPPGPSWSMEEPSLTRRHGMRVWRVEMKSDTDSNNQHWIVMQAIEHDGSVLVMAFQQTRDYYKERLPFVLDLFEHVRPAGVR